MHKKNHLHLMPFDVLLNKKKLIEWCASSKEIELFGLNEDILFDEDLLLQWFTNFKNNPESVFKNMDKKEWKIAVQKFHEDNPDAKESKPDISFIENMMEFYKKAKPTLSIFEKSAINSGISVEDLNLFKNDKIEEIANKLTEDIAHFTVVEKQEYFKNILPILTADFEEKKSEFFYSKAQNLKDFSYDKLTDNLNFGILTFNKNHWNENCYNLFLYLVDNYEKKGKVKYTNIHFYLKNHVDKNKYVYNQTIETYTHFINLRYEIQLKTFRKAEFEFLDHQVPIMNDIEGEYSSQK